MKIGQDFMDIQGIIKGSRKQSSLLSGPNTKRERGGGGMGG